MKAWNLICDVSRKGILTLTMLDHFVYYTPPQILCIGYRSCSTIIKELSENEHSERTTFFL